MKYTLFLMTLMIIWVLSGCGPKQQESTEVPGPVTESDKYRYGINPNDEMSYNDLDSTDMDTTNKDTTKKDTLDL